MEADKDIEEIETRYKDLVSRKDALSTNKVKVEAEHAALKRQLKDAMEEAKKAGFDPNNLQEEIRHAKEVLLLKMDNFAADLAEGETQIAPMLKALKETG